MEGEELTGIEILDPGLEGPLSRVELPRRVIRIRRRGKYIIFKLDKGFLVMHLRITGRLILGELRGPETRAILHFRGASLSFLDRRRMATAEFVEDISWLEARLGPEPLGDLSWLPGALRESRRPIKVWLLDQKNIAGIGNIYASEVLFVAGIDPRRPANSLSEEEAVRLSRAIREVLAEAIAHRGTTFSDYRDSSGDPGGYQEFLRVYRRAGKPCKKCGTPIERIELGGRGTFFCPRCQR